MFYSHTILARKGPLGTVWCAAHLQKRLKKSHYTATDIPSTVDRIMFPEVPIALRMSGHLLLGVVRIYSKKVDYLLTDCKDVWKSLKTAFASIDLSLPENAMQAPLQSITLPDTLYLDALDCGGDFDYEGAHDDHLRNQEDITLTEQFPIATNPYVAITFDEDIQMEDLSHRREDFGSDATPMDVDTVPPHLTDEQMIHNDEVNLPGFQETSGVASPTDEQPRPSDDFTLPDFPETEAQTDLGFHDSGLNQSPETFNLSRRDCSSPENVPEIEAQRNAVSDISSETFPFSSSPRNDGTEPHDPPTNEKSTLSPIMEGSIHSGGPSPLVQPSSGTPASVSSLSEGRPNINTSVSVAIQSTPPIEQPPIEQPIPRKRKKQYFDDPVVLSNEFMKKILEDASGLKRKRKNIPSSTLGIWKLNNRLRKEQVILQPSLTGLCSDLCNIYNEKYISTKSHLFEEALPDSRLARSPSLTPTEVFSEPRSEPSLPPFPPLTTDVASEHGVGHSIPADEASPEYRDPHSPSSPATGCDPDIERFRGVEHDGANILPDSIPSPTNWRSPRIDDLTPTLSHKMGSASVPPFETSIGTQILQTPDLPVSTAYSESEFGTPRTILEESVRSEYTGPSRNPEPMTAEAEDLWFLEADDRTPAGSQGTEGVDSLSVRTRAVAQYLKSQSPEDLSSDLSLNKILEGKRRKLCARMFFETLVLKSYDLIDVKQEVPYGDISLKLTRNLSKAQI